MIGSISSPAGNLDQATAALATAASRVASGKRINSAQDDPAASAIVAQMAAQLGSNSQAQRNVADGLSLTNTASGALDQVSGTLQSMRELAVQAANGASNPTDLQALQTQFTQLGQSLDQISGQTQFNGQNLLDGSLNAQIQTGPNAGDTQSLSLGAVSTKSLGVNGLDLTSAQGASSALNAIDQAIATVGTQQSTLGAAQASLSSTSANLASTYENVAAAKSRIGDTDYASASTNLAQANVQQQVALQAVSLYNANQASVLGLIKKP